MNDQQDTCVTRPDDAAAAATSDGADGRGRRRFMFGGLGAAFAVAVAACSSDANDASKSTAGLGGSTSANSSGTTAPTAGANSSSPDTSTGSTGATDTTTVDTAGSVPAIPSKAGDVDGGRDPNNPTGAEPSAELANDLKTAAFAAGIEVLAVNTYRRTAVAANAGQLGAVPAAVAEFVDTVTGHHQAALDQWNRALILSGKPPVATPNATLQPTVDAAFADVADVEGAARLALMLEEIAAATYLAAVPDLKSPEAIALVASIYPIDMQHAAVLHFVLGEYPVPDVFGKIDMAATPS